MPTRYSKQTAKTGAAIGTVIAAPKPGNYTGTNENEWNNYLDDKFEGWIECKGQTLQVNDYRALYSVIGNTYGGTTNVNFKLPDYRSKKLFGTGTLNSRLGASRPVVTTSGPDGTGNGSHETAGSTGGYYTLPTIRQLPAGSEITPGSPSNPVTIGGNSVDTFSLGNFRSQGFTGVKETIDINLSGNVSFGFGPVRNTSINAVPPHFHTMSSVGANTQKVCIAQGGKYAKDSDLFIKENTSSNLFAFRREFRLWPGSQAGQGFGGASVTVPVNSSTGNNNINNSFVFPGGSNVTISGFGSVGVRPYNQSVDSNTGIPNAVFLNSGNPLSVTSTAHGGSGQYRNEELGGLKDPFGDNGKYFAFGGVNSTTLKSTSHAAQSYSSRLSVPAAYSSAITDMQNQQLRQTTSQSISGPIITSSVPNYPNGTADVGSHSGLYPPYYRELKLTSSTFFTGFQFMRLLVTVGNDTNGGERPQNAGESMFIAFNNVVDPNPIVPSRGDTSGAEYDSYDDTWSNEWTSILIAIPAGTTSITFFQYFSPLGVGWTGSHGINGTNEHQGGNDYSNTWGGFYDMYGIAELQFSTSADDYVYTNDGIQVPLRRHSHMLFWDEPNSGDQVPANPATFGVDEGVGSSGLRTGSDAGTTASVNNSIGTTITKTVDVVNDIALSARPATITMLDQSRVNFDAALSVRFQAAEDLVILSPYFRSKYIIKAY